MALPYEHISFKNWPYCNTSPPRTSLSSLRVDLIVRLLPYEHIFAKSSTNCKVSPLTVSGLFSDCISFLGNTSDVIQLVLLHIALQKINPQQNILISTKLPMHNSQQQSSSQGHETLFINSLLLDLGIKDCCFCPQNLDKKN